MRILKRVFLYIKKHIGKTLLVTSIITVVFTLILSSNAIVSSVEDITKNARKDMTPNVTLTTDMQKAIQSSTGYATDEKVYTAVKNSNYTKEVHAQVSLTITHDLKVANSSSNEGESFIMGGNATDMENPLNYLRSIEKGEENLFSKGTNKLIEGVMPYESEETNGVLISKEIANKNNLKIGNTFPIKGIWKNRNEKTELKIVGIYENNAKANDMDQYVPFASEKYVMYTTFDSAIDILKKSQQPTDVVEFETIQIILKDVNSLDAFKEEISKNKDIQTDNLIIRSDADKYKKMTKNIDAVADTSTTVLFVSCGAAIVILGLVIALSLKDRRYEIGVLMSLGEEKAGLVLQMVIETLTVGIISFLLALALSGSVSNTMVSSFMPSEKNEISQPQENFIFDGGTQEEEVDSIDDIKVSVYTMENITVALVLGGGILLLTSILPTLWILRKNPKMIMIREE